MIDGPYFVLTVLGALACGLAAGVFAAFSTFVMGVSRRCPRPRASPR